MSDLMYSNWGHELQSIIENMDTKEVKEAMSQTSLFDSSLLLLPLYPYFQLLIVTHVPNCYTLNHSFLIFK